MLHRQFHTGPSLKTLFSRCIFSLVLSLLILMHVGLGESHAMAESPTLDATLDFTFLGQYGGEGRYNQYHFSVENTGDVDIFAVFLYPQSPAYTGGAENENTTSAWDSWAGWSAATYDPSSPPVHYWYKANDFLNPYITEIDDVPNPNGWEYGDWLGIWWNTSHDPTTHSDSEDSLVPGSTITDLYYTIWGVDYGDPSVPALDVMLAGYDSGSGSVITKTFTLNAVPVPAAAWLFGSAIAGIVGLRKQVRKSFS